MKKRFLFLPFLLFTGFSSYDRASYIPMLMDRTVLEQSVQMVDSAMPIRTPGRIYVYQHWLLLVEQYKGIHLIDNADPGKPLRKAFLRVPGCQSLAVGRGILYVDNAVDLVGVKVDLQTLRSQEVARNRKALPEIESPDGYIPSQYSRINRPLNTEIVGWTTKTAAL